MPETFVDKRRNLLRELIKGYGGDPQDAQQYLDMWLKGRLSQKEVEMVVARDHGATSAELAEQFGYSDGVHAMGAVNRARHKVTNEERGTNHG